MLPCCASVYAHATSSGTAFSSCRGWRAIQKNMDPDHIFNATSSGTAFSSCRGSRAISEKRGRQLWVQITFLTPQAPALRSAAAEEGEQFQKNMDPDHICECHKLRHCVQQLQRKESSFSRTRCQLWVQIKFITPQALAPHSAGADEGEQFQKNMVSVVGLDRIYKFISHS